MTAVAQQGHRDISPALGRAATDTVAAILVAGLSDGRRRRAILDVGPTRTFQTDGAVVTVPFPLTVDGGVRALVVGVALQCSPTKDAVARMDWPALRARERQALRCVEGDNAVRWAADRWPGLRDALDAVCPWVEPATPALEPEELLRQALARAAGGRPDEPPAIYGRLPPARADAGRGTGRTTAIATRWTTRRRTRRHGALPIPISGPAGERVTHAGEAGGLEALEGHGDRQLGVPYDEWDRRAGRYRRNYVRVVELDEGPAQRPAERPPEIIAPPLRPARHRRRGQEDGDVDIDAVVAWRCSVAAGISGDAPRLFARLDEALEPMAFGLLVDGSASSTHGGGRVLRRSVRHANALAAALTRDGHLVGAFSFCSRSRERIEVRRLKEFTAGYAPFGHSLVPSGYTRMGGAIRHVGARLLRVPAARRTLILLGDAVPSDEGYDGRYGRADVAKAVHELRRAGTSVVQVVPDERDPEPLQEMFGRDGWHVAPAAAALEPLLADIAHELRRTA